MRLILGSQSASRKEVLARMGYHFETISPDIDEKTIRRKDPGELTLALARAKAQALLSKLKLHEPSILITCDQVVVCKGAILEKPENRDEAKKFLQGYAQHPAETVTSIVVVNTRTGESREGTDIARVHFHPIASEAIDAYIESGDAFTRAGGFAYADPILAPYVNKIEGDPDSVAGLPGILVKKFITELS